ncbi:serine protein kinase RIO [Nanoarchaeota archaeon]
MPKISKEKWKTWGNVFDEFTLRTLFKLSSQGHFDHLVSPLFIGKESNVFTAVKDKKKIIVKIYRLETCDFNMMYTYIRTDPRYAALKKQRRKIIFAWVQREYRNLLKARDAGVNVPTPLAVRNNVLVLEFIGNDTAAPRLKDLQPKDIKGFYKKTMDNFIKLYKAGLIHADFSEFNILNHNENPVLIDFSQSSPVSDPNAEIYLKRDIKNMARFFNKMGLKIKEEAIFKDINKD